MLMSDLTHRSLACKAHLNILIENALYKFITISLPLMYGSLCHLEWYQSAIFSFLAHGLRDEVTMANWRYLNEDLKDLNYGSQFRTTGV